MRALVVHFQFENFGGAETVSIRIAKILQQRFEEVVILHAHWAPDPSWLIAHTGQRIDPNKVKFCRVNLPLWLRRLTRDRPSVLGLLQYAFVVRAARHMGSQFDLIVSTFAECPVRRHGMIQFIHVPVFVSDRQSLQYCGLEFGPFRRALQFVYIALVRVVMGKRQLISQQLTVANSKWTKEQFLRHYKGGDIRVLYPGVRAQIDETHIKWAQRENRMTIVGRITPGKRIETGIGIVERLRGRGHRVGLDIVGGGNGAYHDTIVGLAAARPWIGFHERISRSDLEALIMRNKWGLHCYESEHYGLAPAEMQALGSIVFVHDSGGQREIIRHSLQRYRDVDQAVSNIAMVMQSASLQAQLLEQGRVSASHHRAADFDLNADRLAQEMIEQRSSRQIGFDSFKHR